MWLGPRYIVSLNFSFHIGNSVNLIGSLWCYHQTLPVPCLLHIRRAASLNNSFPITLNILVLWGQHRLIFLGTTVRWNVDVHYWQGIGSPCAKAIQVERPLSFRWLDFCATCELDIWTFEFLSEKSYTLFHKYGTLVHLQIKTVTASTHGKLPHSPTVRNIHHHIGELIRKSLNEVMLVASFVCVCFYGSQSLSGLLYNERKIISVLWLW